jgi:hypothetical protein
MAKVAVSVRMGAAASMGGMVFRDRVSSCRASMSVPSLVDPDIVPSLQRAGPKRATLQKKSLRWRRIIVAFSLTIAGEGAIKGR